MAGRFESRVAVITGGASGIGRATADRIVAEGGRVVLGDVDDGLLAAAAAELGDACATVHADVTVEADVEALCAAATERFGGLDIGVNSAGVGTFAPIVDHPVEEWDRLFAITLRGVFLSVKHEARRMRESGGGAIVNLASINARLAAEGMAAYSTAKAGVEMFTRCAAMELGADGIRVCGVGPGLVETPLTAFARQLPQVHDAYVRNTPLGRAGQPGDIAAAICFLASDDASWISGETLFVDGAALTREYPRFFSLFDGG